MDDIDQLRDRCKNFRIRLEMMRKLQSDVSLQLETARQEVEDRQKVQDVLRLMAERLNEESEVLTEKVATLGLKDTFYDEDLSLEVEHYVSHSKPAVKLLINDGKRKFKGEPSKAFGGGPGALLGVLLRILSIVRQPHLARILILDEPILSISKEYKERAVRIIRKICDPPEQGGLGFSILMVTHDDVYKKAAHHSYFAHVDSDGQSLAISRKPPEVEEVEETEE